MNKQGRQYIFIGAILVMIALFAVSLLAGKYPLNLGDLLAGEEMAMRVFLTLRLPRTIMALLGGFSLGIAGMIFQTVFQNHLASPDIIGVSSGASAGAAFGILFFSGSAVWVTASAFVGSLSAVLLALGLASAVPGKKKSTMVLSGLVIHSLAQTVLMMLKLTADPEKELASIEYWMMGSLNGITKGDLPFTMVISGICIALLFLLYRQVLLLSMEEGEAAMLGVPVRTMQLIIFILATLLTASIVSVTGIISFIGLLAPHCARLLTKNDRIETLWLSGVIGGILFCGADILARTAADVELPVSIFTSLIGAPFLVYLLMRKETDYE